MLRMTIKTIFEDQTRVEYGFPVVVGDFTEESMEHTRFRFASLELILIL